jgi:hypothetical protein
MKSNRKIMLEVLAVKSTVGIPPMFRAVAGLTRQVVDLTDD